MDEIARRAGVTVPVVYDHFTSKQELHCCLLERHFEGLRDSWRNKLLSDGPAIDRIASAMDAFYAYVEANPYAWKMLFRDTGDDVADAIRREVAEKSWSEVLRILPKELGADRVFGADAEGREMLTEVLRAGMQGLAVWWHAHQHVPHEKVVRAAMNVFWLGFDRIGRGQVWRGEVGSKTRRRRDR
jgi:AcrR family transcriptional regulator